MEYTSTRDATKRISAAEAIVTGLSPDGGLFVPVKIQPVDFRPLIGSAYNEVAYAVLRGFLPEYSEDFLRGALADSYGKNFGGKAGELVPLADSASVLELWHGPTAAFKDYALQLMPRLLVEAKRLLARDESTLILVATSGDTGKAALEGFKDIPGIKIAVFYPESGTSEVQRLQMVTQDGDNVAVYAVRGNFDDAQRGVKQAFGDAALAEKLAAKNEKLSSANSINWGRLLPQIVYYATSYLRLCAAGTISYGQPLDFCVPTGNFGDIMAGYYAKQLGIPVGKLICASNQNNVLAEFLETGRYNAQRPFYKTSSPSMDILVSSNLERLLYHASGSDEKVRGWMRQLAETGSYQIDADTLAAVRAVFAGGWVDENEVGEEIAQLYEQQGYLCDPHTAVAFRVLRRRRAAGDDTPTVVLSTASPFKFSGKVLSALGHIVPQDEFQALDALEKATGQTVPASLASLQGRPVRFTESIDPAQIPAVPLSL